MSTPRAIRATVRAFVREHDLLPPGALVVAVSGGTDSSALLVLLAELAPALGLLLHVAHFDHRLRPRSAAADAQYVADLAQRHGATIRLGRAERPPRSEDDAREQRYAFLRRVAREAGARAIATGHTRDDQAETVLLHLVRGSGITGLAAMRPKRDDIVRPLLPIGRAETMVLCRAAGLQPREDPTNRSLVPARNRIRHAVLPELARINPQVHGALARLADAAAQVADETALAADVALAAATSAEGIVLARLPAALRDEALARAWRERTGRTLGARHRAALARLAAERGGAAGLDLPGGRAIRSRGLLRLDARVRPPVRPAGAPPPASVTGSRPAVSRHTRTIEGETRAPAGQRGRRTRTSTTAS